MFVQIFVFLICSISICEKNKIRTEYDNSSTVRAISFKQLEETNKPTSEILLKEVGNCNKNTEKNEVIVESNSDSNETVEIIYDVKKDKKQKSKKRSFWKGCCSSSAHE